MIELLILHGCCTIQLQKKLSGCNLQPHTIRWDPNPCGNVLVDEADFQWLNQDRWLRLDYLTGQSYYAYRYETVNRKQVQILMSREILRLPRRSGRGSVVADHQSHDIRDYTRGNLRIATNSQNARNSITKGSGQLPKGVAKNGKGFMAQISIARSIPTICFTTVPLKIEAGLMYNYGADLVFGEHACLNIIPEDEMPTYERQWELYDLVIAKLREKNVPFDESRIAQR